MRLPRVVARAALIVALAPIAAPGTAGSRVHNLEAPLGPTRVTEVRALTAGELSMTTFALAATDDSDGRLDGGSSIAEPPHASTAPEPPQVAIPDVPAGVAVLPAWNLSRSVSFFGPGLYGRRTACGLELSFSLVGVAHRTLPCGTLVTFRNPVNGRTLTMPVVDRGPYVSGRIWDLTGGSCVLLDHCYTGRMYWTFAG